MKGWLKEDVDILMKQLKADLDLISSKEKDDEWKRDHYRYTFTVSVQRMYDLLNSQITGTSPAPIQESTKKEIQELIRKLEEMIS